MEFAYERLAEAIVARALQDYHDLRTTPVVETAECNLTELHKFFHSTYFKMLTDADPDYLLDQINRRTAQIVRDHPLVRGKAGAFYYVYRLEDIATVEKGNHNDDKD
jgi:hypothetical protein